MTSGPSFIAVATVVALACAMPARGQELHPAMGGHNMLDPAAPGEEVYILALARDPYDPIAVVGIGGFPTQPSWPLDMRVPDGCSLWVFAPSGGMQRLALPDPDTAGGEDHTHEGKFSGGFTPIFPVPQTAPKELLTGEESVKLRWRPGPRIDGFQPTSGGAGTVITLEGAGFDLPAERYCAGIMDPGTGLTAFVRVDEVTSTSMELTIGAVPPGLSSGNLRIIEGDGDYMSPASSPELVVLPPGFKVWLPNGGAMASSEDEFTLIPSPPSGGCLTFLADFTNPVPPFEAEFLLPSTLTAPANSTVSIQFDVFSSAGTISFDTPADLLTTSTINNPLGVALALCTKIQDAYTQKVLNCTGVLKIVSCLTIPQINGDVIMALIPPTGETWQSNSFASITVCR